METTTVTGKPISEIMPSTTVPTIETAKPKETKKTAPKKTVAKEPEKIEKKKTTTSKKPRKIDELIEASTRGMTDKEKSMLINHLKEEVTKKDEQIKMYENNCKSAYEQKRTIDDQYDSMERYYRERLSFINKQVNAFTEAIRLATIGGTK